MPTYELVELLDKSFRGTEIGALNFEMLRVALLAMAQDKKRIDIDSETAARWGLSDSGIKDFGKEISKESIKEENRESDISKEPTGEDHGTSDDEEAKKHEDDAQHATTKRSSDEETKPSPTDIRASETKVKTEGEEEQQDTGSQGMQEEWNYLRLNGRVEGLHRGMNLLSELLDLATEKLSDVETESEETSNLAQQLKKYMRSCTERTTKLEENVTALTTSLDDSKDQMKNEVERLKVSLNEGFESAKEDMLTNMEDINTKVSEVRDLITPREDFSELAVRVDQLEKEKVGREELGRFMEEGFIENFIKEHESLRTDLDATQAGVAKVDNDAKALSRKIDEMQTYIDDSSEGVEDQLETIKTKLDTLDANDINDTFAKLEDKTEELTEDLESLQLSGKRIEKEAKVNSKELSDLRNSLKKLETSKMDQAKMYELLDMKANLESLLNKLDRSEFASVMIDIDRKVKELTGKVEETEKNLEKGLSDTRRQLSFKMYTEDFVPATQPMRNRIMAMIYEQQEIKELVLTRFLPDAPGVVKCFSCKRAANLTNEMNHQKKFKSPNQPKSTVGETQNNDERLELPPIDLVRDHQKKFKSPNQPESTVGETQNKDERVKLPPIDLDDLNSVPFPPADQPRTQDLYKLPGQTLPYIFTNAKPRVGLKHPKKRQDIDKELSESFGFISKERRAIGGAHTKTLPQQRGLKFIKKTFPTEQKCKVFIEGSDKRVYRGAVSKEAQLDLPRNNEEKDKDGGSQSSEEQTYDCQDPKIVYPTVVALHRGSVPVPSKKYVPMSVPK